MKEILVTGGAGYIGAYVVKQALNDGYSVVVVDNLSRGSVEAIPSNAVFYNCDLRDEKALADVFKNHKIDIVMHFAAKIVVSESIENPIDYYDNNVVGTKVLLKVMVDYNINNLVFSSTAAVYGLLDKGENLINEEDPTRPINPYGETKLATEKMIEWVSEAHNFNYIIFRYFNVAGGLKVGFDQRLHTALIPKIINITRGLNSELAIYGNDYPTKDGTCIRDYIYIKDLVNAHLLAVKKILSNKHESGIYNLGNGSGYSVIDVVEAANNILNKDIKYTISKKREGDPVISVASSYKAKKLLGWEIEVSDIEEIIQKTYSGIY